MTIPPTVNLDDIDEKCHLDHIPTEPDRHVSAGPRVTRSAAVAQTSVSSQTLPETCFLIRSDR